MSSLGEVVPQVVPEEVVEHGLGDAGGPHVGDVPLLTAPLHPARLSGAGVHQHHRLHPLRVGQGVPGQHIGAQTHTCSHITLLSPAQCTAHCLTYSDVLDDGELVEDLLDLLGQLLHAGVLVVGREGGGAVFLARGVDVEHLEGGSDLLKQRARHWMTF